MSVVLNKNVMKHIQNDTIKLGELLGQAALPGKSSVYQETPVYQEKVLMRKGRWEDGGGTFSGPFFFLAIVLLGFASRPFF